MYIAKDNLYKQNFSIRYTINRLNKLIQNNIKRKHLNFFLLGDEEEEWSKENGFIPIIHWSAQTAIGM